ncbi:hypothetical protein BDK51DRAFT_17643, partial [Blyttiomyces helicus]
PFLAKFAQVENGFETVGSSYSLYWNIDSPGMLNESIHGCLVFDGNAYRATGLVAPSWKADHMWIGFGIGPSMLTADFILAHVTPGNPPSILALEARPAEQYSPPVNSSSPMDIFSGHNQTFANNSVFVEFRRRTRPRDGIHRDIDITTNISCIWAFNPNPDPRGANGWKFHHDVNRGAYIINWLTGNDAVSDGVSIYAKRIHGAGMASAWLLAFPFAIYYGRYLRSRPGWMWVHIIVQCFGLSIVIFFASYVINSLQSNWGTNTWQDLPTRAHPLTGLILFPLTMVQGFFGLFNRLGMSVESFNVDRSRFNLVRFVHNWLGRLLVVAGFVQTAMGVQTLFPWEEAQFRGLPVWIVWVVLVAGWIVLFAITEVVYQRRAVNADSKLIRVEGKTRVQPPRGKTGDGPEMLPLMELAAASSSNVSGELPSYTWEEIDASVQSGHLLVVADGRFVYGIDEWITSHPGGQIILHSVAGTDVTSDYFHEAGFDAAAFVPKAPSLEKQRNVNRHLPDVAPPAYFVPVAARPLPESFSAVANTAALAKLSPTEWKNVVRARRVHVHTKLAIQKLSTLLVGELAIGQRSNRGNTSTKSLLPPNSFEPTEYRRFAIVSSQLQTTSGGTLNPVYRLKFCTLYPHDTRLGEPIVFLPGHCVEIQARVNGRYVSRYYTPIGGGPVGFEIFVKVTPNGVFSPFLAKQKPGDRQFKVRGPFGTPIVDPERPLTVGANDWCLDRLLLITAGSGLAPALQLIEYLFLPTYVPLAARATYVAQNPDELTVSDGDWVMTRSHTYDGWAEGINLTTTLEGVFPLPVTIPHCGSNVRVALLSTVRSPYDSFGTDILAGALNAYPQNIAITHRLSRGLGLASAINPTADADLAAELCPGTFAPGRINDADVADAVNAVGWLFPSDEHPEAADVRRRQRAFVCGPRAFEGFVYETLCDAGLAHDDVSLLPDDRYL